MDDATARRAKWVAAGAVSAVAYLIGRGIRSEPSAVAFFLGNGLVLVAVTLVFLVWFTLPGTRLRSGPRYSTRALVAVLSLLSAWVLWGAFATLFAMYSDPDSGHIAKAILQDRFGDPRWPIVWALLVGSGAFATATAMAAGATWARASAFIMAWLLTVTGTPITAILGFFLWWWWLSERGRATGLVGVSAGNASP